VLEDEKRGVAVLPVVERPSPEQEVLLSLINSSKEGYTSLVFALETDRDADVCYCEVWRIYLKKPNN